jgi:hypothetical protein
MRYARIGDEMPKTTRKLTYEEFAEHLPDVLDELPVTHDPILVENDGRTFRVALAEPALDPRLPPLLPLEERLELLRQSAGGFHTPDREKFLEELRIMREQDSEGRPG